MAHSYAKRGGGGTTGSSEGYDGRTVANTPGSGCQGAMPQRPIPGPQNPGPPASMRKALSGSGSKYTSGRGTSLPNRNTSYPGSR